MSGLSRQEIADRSGVELAFVDRLVEADILQPTADGSIPAPQVRRVLMVRTLEDAGVQLDTLSALIDRGELGFDFLDHSLYDFFSSLSDVTFRKLSEQTGVPVELLMVIREAVGSALPEADDKVREDELEIAPLVQYQLELGFDPAVIERSLRVAGESMRRLAETEADWWDSQIASARQADGSTPGGAGRETIELGVKLNTLIDRAVLAIRRAHQQHAWTAGLITRVEYTLERAGVRTNLDRPPAICFLDLTGYTRLTQERGDEASARLASDLSRMVQRTSLQHGGKPIKWLGDGVMFHFRDPGPGVMAALDMVESAADVGLPPAHVGLHAGPVLFQDGDYFGNTVIVASRIAEYARPGEVLVTDEVVAASAEASLSFSEIGPVELKGVSGAIRLHAAHRNADADESRVTPDTAYSA